MVALNLLKVGVLLYLSVILLFIELRDGIFKLLRSPGIDSMESIPPAYVDGARICKPFKQPRNRFPAWRDGTTSLFTVPARQAT